MRTVLIACLILSSNLQLHAQRREPPAWMHRPKRTTSPHKPSVREAYKPHGCSNVLTANLPAITVIGRNGCIAAGVEYEHFLNKPGQFSIALSVYGFTTPSDANPELLGISMLPAILYHPRGNARLIDYSAGLVIGGGRLHSQYYDRDGTMSTITGITDYYSVVLGQLNLTLHHTKAFVFAVHLSAGALLEDRQAAKGFVQFGLKFGGRF